ncbi:MAG: hypothetical protein H0T42_01520 [Deltaproteobacteria bacterium]|nr:hypothetical protein [Deltaproteobacteria bacterium]
MSVGLRTAIALAAVGILAACPGSKNVECRDDSSCDIVPGGRCFASSAGNTWCAYPDPACPDGYRYSDLDVGDGVAGECVSGHVDAGVDGDVPTDAPLNCPSTAPVQNGQAADLVLGQPGFTSGGANNPFLSGSSISTTVGLLADGTRLWVSDAGNKRTLQWNSFPAVNGQAASIAIGQPDLITATGGVTQSRFDGGSYIAKTGTKLLISDSLNNRVLIWNSIPTTSGQAADLVLGQPDFTTKVSGTGASNLYGPRGIWTDGTKLIVADRFNNRILIWNTFPTTNGAPADVVLGTATFGTAPFVMPPTASSLQSPAGIFVANGKLYVADEANSRVLAWNAIPTANNAPADQVIGQSGFDTAYSNGGAPYPQVNAIGMVGPTAVVVDECGSMYICDNINGRVMVYTTVPTGNAPAANAVLGKPDLATQPSASIPASSQWMHGCSGLAVAGSSVYVGDAGNNRVLRFALSR